MENNDNKLDILTKKIYEEGIEKALTSHRSLYVKMMSVIIVLLSITSNNCFGQTILNDSHWELVWEDNFDYLDLSTWKVANNFDHYGEQQVYTNRSNNVFVSNGNLVLKVQKEEYHCSELSKLACNKEWYSYTSGWVETQASKNVQLGGQNYSNSIPVGKNVYLRATNSVEIEGDFSVPIGSSLFIDVNPCH